VGYVVCCTVILARQCARFQKILDIDKIGLRDLEEEASRQDKVNLQTLYHDLNCLASIGGGGVRSLPVIKISGTEMLTIAVPLYFVLICFVYSCQNI
jgi:hypothetical protein